MLFPAGCFCIFTRRKLTRLQLHQDLPLSAGELHNKTGPGLQKVEKVDNIKKVEKIAKIAKVEKIPKVGPSREILKILVGNWVAQWDQTYKTWFYYNINTGLSSVLGFKKISSRYYLFFVDISTWEKPRELQHVQLNPPSG